MIQKKIPYYLLEMLYIQYNSVIVYGEILGTYLKRMLLISKKIRVFQKKQ